MSKATILDKSLSQRNTNNFDFFRFVGSIIVVLCHSFGLTGTPCEPFAGVSITETVGWTFLASFFIASGFLITGSWFSDEDILSFVSKRILRIYPALICVVILTAFVLAPLISHLSLKEYFLDGRTYQYLKNASLLSLPDRLPGVFTDNKFPGAVNGSLWTLRIELKLYAMVAVLGVTRLLKIRYLLPALVVLPISFFLRNYIGNGEALFADYHTSALTIYFIMGAIYYVFRDKIILSIHLFVPASILYLLSFYIKYGPFIAFFTLPYLFLYLAFLKNSFTNNWGKYGDYSYGIYIYAFPLQQTIIWASWNKIQPWQLFALSTPITIILAVMSWHLIEKGAMRLKKPSLRGVFSQFSGFVPRNLTDRVDR